MITIEARVAERDIDFLLLEELVANEGFRRWFLGRLGAGPDARLERAGRSVVTPVGESDLELTVREGAEVSRIFVENKIDAVLQPRQGERYAERGAAELRAGRCQRVMTVLIAPASYSQPVAGFDRKLPYEEIESELARSGESDVRLQHKLWLLRSAIERSASGWTLKPDDVATSFWQRYWELAEARAPELQMPRPGVKPSTSGFVRFAPAELPRGVALIHKVPYGHVDLQFAGRAARLAAFNRKHRTHLKRGMRIERAAKSLVVRMEVRPASVRGPLDEVEPVIRDGLKAARQLLAWYRIWER